MNKKQRTFNLVVVNAQGRSESYTFQWHVAITEKALFEVLCGQAEEGAISFYDYERGYTFIAFSEGMAFHFFEMSDTENAA